MHVLSAAEVEARLDFPSLLDALEAMFLSGCEVPLRHHHTVDVPGEPAGTALMMPAWSVGGYLGVKLVNVFPGNRRNGEPAISAIYALCSATSGKFLALMDGAVLTARRTAAASALAARRLARADASRLLIVGTGAVARQLAAAHSAVRPIRSVRVWGRDPAQARRLAASLADFGAEAVDDLATAVPEADIVSCATLSQSPLIRGEWLAPGTHLDLIGSFTPAMREADDEAVRRARVFVDTRQGATTEAGDIVLALRSGALALQDIRADLADLVRGAHQGRSSAEEITLFKSVGLASEDLAAAGLVHQRGSDRPLAT